MQGGGECWRRGIVGLKNEITDCRQLLRRTRRRESGKIKKGKRNQISSKRT